MNIGFTKEEMLCIAKACFEKQQEVNARANLYEACGDIEGFAASIAKLRHAESVCASVIAKLDDAVRGGYMNECGN